MVLPNQFKDEDIRLLAIQNLKGSEKERVIWMLSNMNKNKVFTYRKKLSGGKSDEDFLEDLKSRYIDYRQKWRSQPDNAFKKKLYGKKFKEKKNNPLCIDIEVASVCDLACPHCYRQYISTPDKIMDPELAYKLIDQAADLKVPSMKFNWRGEPLLHPKLSEIIDYAKSKGVLETIINTNATKLDEKTSEKIIKSGLDIMIYSFDGGSKKSYEKMRPGRFSNNDFNTVYENIKKFNSIRKKLGSVFPRTKIQMVLTEETHPEQKQFFKLFSEIVDEVSVKQYTERGGNLDDINDKFKNNIKHDIKKLKKLYGNKANLMKDSDGNVYISEGRLPCEQPFQRMLVTYDGRTSMCCYDWGSMHPVGYVDKKALDIGDKEYKKVKDKADAKVKGFELMNLEMPRNFNTPKENVETLNKIWNGKEINLVRENHILNKLNQVEICKACPFKETYKWKKIS